MRPLRLLLILFVLSCCARHGRKEIIMTVKGPVEAENSGMWLTHEHILVDFIGADSIGPGRYNRTDVIRRTLPFLLQARELGCKTFVECTPEYLGRDPELLRALADSSGVNILTNTGFYGAGRNKHIPSFAFSMTAEELADIWISE